MSSIWAEEKDEIEFPPNGTSLTLLQEIYKNPAMPLHTRMRAAMACLKHEHASLGITFQASETDFANLLDARIARHQAKLIEHQPQSMKPMPTANSMRRRI
jgi:hypothetical protein